MPATGDANPQALDAAADALQAKFERATALHRQGNSAEAEAVYRDILRQRPDHVDALHRLGVIALQLGQTAQAADYLTRAVALQPNLAEVYSDLGVALKNLQRPAEALANYDKAIALKPDFAMAFNNRGNLLQDLNRPVESLADCDKAIELDPSLAIAHYNRGNALTILKRPADALPSYDNAIALQPDFVLAHNNRGRALEDLNRPADAIASYAKAIALQPDFADAYLNQSICLLQLGRFEQGWRQYEWRKKRLNPVAIRSFPQPLWLGEQDIAGKTLFIWWEQGYGDTIQFCRYGRLAQARGAKVVMSVQQALYRLLKQIGPSIEILPADEVPAGFDYHCPLMSLPLAFGTTSETIPAQRPYLKPDQSLVSAWAARLPRKTKPRIGVVWSGTSTYKNDFNRSIELERLLPVLNDDAQWICLQKEIRENDLAVLRQDGRIAFHGDELEDFSDTAALLDLVDLVVTVDTSVAHLAGAMGKPVWILLPYNPDWRWLLNRDDSPWYPTARLFRQRQIGDWAGVIERVNDELRSAIG